MLRRAIVVCGLVLGVAASVYVPHVYAARNGSGTYSLPSGTTVTSGTTITSTWANSFTSDVATELTGSLSRNGYGAMLAPLRCTNGTVGAPSLTFDSDTDTGLYRIGANNPGMSAGGTKIQEWSTTGSTFPLTLAVTGAQTNAAGITVTQSTSNGTAGTFTGNGSGNGITATSGTSGGGNGGSFTAGTGSGGDGVSGLGDDDGYGGTFTGGSSAGDGVRGQGGAGAGAGGRFTGGSTGDGVIGSAGGSVTADANTRFAFTASAGHIKLAGGNPTKTRGFTNVLTPTAFIKAWGVLTMSGSGTVTVTSGFNVASAACGGTGNDDMTVTLASAFTGTNNFAVVSNVNSATGLVTSTNGSSTTFTLHGIFHCDTDTGGQVQFIAVGLQ